jgi:hypothetical protein
METLRYVVLANGLLAVVSIVFYVLLRRETFFEANRLALWLGLTASLVLPLVQLPDWRPQPVKAVMQRTAQVIVPRVLPGPPALQPDVTITFPNGQTYPAFPERLVRAGWSWQQGLLGLYLTILIVLMGRFGYRLRSLMRLIRRSAQEPYDDFTLVRNTGVTSPFSFFGWVVLNPDQHAPDELEQILRHERVHVRAWHSADMLGAELVSIVFWFNPAAYLFRQLVHQTLEFSADRAVLAEGIDPKLYQYYLVKVSLAAGQSAITNHFSKSQLRSRIVMLNKQSSFPSMWLKYPVLCIAALVVATTFARPQVKALKKYVPAPVAETISAVDQAMQTPTEPAQLIERSAIRNVAKATARPINRETNVLQSAPSVTAVADSVKKDTAPVSPLRYMAYQDGYLYWVVTPKTTFDDLAVMKKEFAKHGHQMQLNEIKYDPLYAYIDRIVVTVVRSTGGLTRVYELDDEDKPIPSVAGFVSVVSTNGSSGGTGGLRYYGKEFPEALHNVAKKDEATIAEFIKNHKVEHLKLDHSKLDHLIELGIGKFKKLGSGSSTFFREFFNNKSTRSSGLIVNSDSSLSVSEELGAIQLFINNQSVAREAVRSLTLERLYAVVKKTHYNSANKELITSALLIYTTED